MCSKRKIIKRMCMIYLILNKIYIFIKNYKKLFLKITNILSFLLNTWIVPYSPWWEMLRGAGSRKLVSLLSIEPGPCVKDNGNPDRFSKYWNICQST